MIMIIEQKYSNWCDTNYIIERNESLKQIISVINNQDNINSLSEEKKPVIDLKFYKQK